MVSWVGARFVGITDTLSTPGGRTRGVRMITDDDLKQRRIRVTDNEIRGPGITASRWVMWLVFGVAAFHGFLVVWGQLTSSLQGIHVAQFIVWSCSGWLWTRPVIVDARGVRMLFGILTPWSSISHIKEPSRWVDTVVFVLHSGKERSTTLPVDLAEDVARIGSVPVGPPAAADDSPHE